MFCNLHVHSAYSLLDSISKPEDIVAKVKAMKQPSVALTDHGNVHASVKLYKLCKQNNIKFIYGCEFYICDDRFIKDKNNKYFHLTILAKNEQGRLNLNKLVSIGHLEGLYYKPRIDFKILSEYRNGLIILSGCMASEFQRTLQGGTLDTGLEITSGNIERAKDVARKYQIVFGDDYYLEVQSHRDIRQQKLNRAIVDIGKELGIQWVSTSDSHFIDAADQELHSIFVQIGREQEVGETYNDTQLQSEDEARQFLKPGLTDEEIDIAIRNTLNIMDKCNVELPLSAPLIPHVEVPKGFSSEEDYLKHLCNQGWVKREINKYPKELIKQYKDRLFYEYNAITQMGFSGYYLLVHSYANTVRRRGIARGSGGGSLVAYLLNIVDIDPIQYGLYFERFIDVSALDLLKEGIIKPEELKIPDFDLDFGSEDREVVVQKLINTYGKDKVASLGNFQYIWDKSAIKDVGRVLGIPFDITNQITKELGEDSIEDVLTNSTFANYKEQYPRLFDYAKKLAGLPRSFGMHPCGKVVVIDELTHYTAISNNDGETVLQVDMNDAELLGLVKCDFLGLRTVDLIYDVLDMIGKDYDYISPRNLNFKDENVLNIFRNGWTDGIFQFESDGMKSTLIKMIPTGLDDLGVANALYRPGSMKYIDNYINRKHGIEKFEYLHPDLKSIVSNTYGIIVFQEQLIEIGRLAGMRNPDELRKATGKKKPEVLAKVEPELRQGLYSRGWSKEQVDQLWEDMLMFAKYSFNKSHSYAYSIIAYIVAYLKAYHPTEFVCALFNSFEGKHEKMNGCYKEAKRLNVEFAKLSFRNPTPLCTVEDGKINYGTSLIKHCNRQIANDLKLLKDNNYVSFIDLLIDIEEKTSLNSRQIMILINLDAFSEFGDSIKLLAIYNEFSSGENRYSKTHKDKTKNKRIDALKTFEVMEQHATKKSITELIQHQIEHLGYIDLTFPNIDMEYAVILEIDKKYTPRITAYHLKTGEEKVYKISKKDFFDQYKEDIFKVGMLIKIKNTQSKHKKKQVDGKWIDLPETEEWISSCSIIQGK